MATTELAPAQPVVEPEVLDVTVVLPVYNEKGHLVEEIDRIRAALAASGKSFEILVVDDGSDDGSGEQLRTVDGIRLLQFHQNRGSGSARKAGTRAARGRVVVWTDADMTYPNHRIPELVDELDGWDQVVGARTSEQGTAKAARVPAKWIIRRLASYLTGTRIPDLNSGLRAFRADVARQYLHLLPPGFSCVTTITMAFLANGYSVKYVPVEYRERAGTSKFHWWHDTKRYLIQVIRLVLSYNPLKIFLPLGLLLGATGVAKLVYDVVDKDFRVTTSTLVLLLATFQVLAIGLLADLVVRLAKRSDEVDPASR
ncbi:MAG: glycosyl transferase, family 2 [uncultured Acidimicrobiales bacterium]|uniref:Glycosyl transferase, family 2 n=1 Tax=uncultured Acidimicrobiales bacterium TaxID=310071 RepID=A0A6J4H698_9ACTN|nr:MAG: glycosyl transferase, family 2 [uncultured Acidimicrobiales bacterium]